MNQMFIRGVALKDTASLPKSYVFDLPAVKGLNKLEFHKNITFLVGENGAGKSTLLEAIAVNYGMNAEGGGRNFRFSTSDTHALLAEYIRVIKGVRRPQDDFFLRAESFYNVASEVESLAASGLGGGEEQAFYENNYGGKSLHRQSHGESFLSLVMHRFRQNGLYLLDEPEAALSPSRQLTLIARLYELAKGGCQFIIATHSPMLLATPGSDIYVLDENGITPTPYEKTEHYQITKQFLTNPGRMLDILCE